MLLNRSTFSPVVVSESGAIYFSASVCSSSSTELWRMSGTVIHHIVLFVSRARNALIHVAGVLQKGLYMISSTL